MVFVLYISTSLINHKFMIPAGLYYANHWKQERVNSSVMMGKPWIPLFNFVAVNKEELYNPAILIIAFA